MSEAEFQLQGGPKALVALWRKIMFEPRTFYRDMSPAGGFENPLIFLALCALCYFVLKVTVAGFADAVNAVFLIGLAYIFGPGILMLASQFIFQGEGDYEGTLRVCAYAGATLTVAWLPTLGILAYLYGFYLVFLGVEKVHKLDTTKAAIVTLIGLLGTGAIMLFVLGEERIRRPLL